MKFTAPLLTTLVSTALILGSSNLIANQAYGQSALPTEQYKGDRGTMTQAKMVGIIKQLDNQANGPDNNLSFVYQGVTIVMVSDVNANRMRLVSAVTDAGEMSQQHLAACLVSNFHLALDARYAIGNGILFSSYIHPMAELIQVQLISAVTQVATLSKTYGTSYTSGALTFGVPAPAAEKIEI